MKAFGQGDSVADARTAARGPSDRLINALTVDVEDYFQVQALAGEIPRASWDAIPRRVEANVEDLLRLLASEGIRATFFTLGWIAERHPEMIRRIAAAGHELASHGYDHTRADQLSPSAFRNDVQRTKRTIEDVCGYPVIGYRAPTFSIGRGNQWVYDVLESEGYLYSSSIYPILHDLYGDTAAPRSAFQPGSGTLWEFPLATRRLFGQNVPSAGGGYFRILPYWLSRVNLRSINAREAMPCVFYLHPWEIDAAQPRVAGIGARARFRHYTNLHVMSARLAQLIRDFRWSRMDHVFADHLCADSSRAARPGLA